MSVPTEIVRAWLSDLGTYGPKISVTTNADDLRSFVTSWLESAHEIRYESGLARSLVLWALSEVDWVELTAEK